MLFIVKSVKMKFKSEPKSFYSSYTTSVFFFNHLSELAFGWLPSINNDEILPDRYLCKV